MPRPKKKEDRHYTTVSIPLSLVDRILRYVNREDAIYKSLVDFTLSALRKELDELHLLRPNLQHFNIDEDKGCVRVIDHEKHIIADVYFTEKGVYCEADDSQNCEHVKYALEIPKVVKKLKKHGWKREIS